MLKTGEFSPNNPLIRGERSGGDVLFGLGEYEHRKNTLKKIQQKQYREYLDQQAQLKREAREKAERERKEKEEKERLAEAERDRETLEGDQCNTRRGSFSRSRVCGANNAYTTKVDTGIQVDRHAPLSVAVQTDDCDLLRVSGTNLTEAERELSPRTALDNKHSGWNCDYSRPSNVRSDDVRSRRRSYGDFDDRNKRSDIYTPSILDAEAIQLRNQKAVQEAAERRSRYQQELRKQIHEQQAIRLERENREKMLEQAEMRRLEEQLRSLKTAQERERRRHCDINDTMKRSSMQFERDRLNLQKEIDEEKKALLQVRNKTHEKHREQRLYSPNYDLENYLRKNLNPTKESLLSSALGSHFRENLPENREIRKLNDMTRSWHGNPILEENRSQMVQSWHQNDNWTENANKPYDPKYVFKNKTENAITENNKVTNKNEFGDTIESKIELRNERKEPILLHDADNESVITKNRPDTVKFDLPIPVLRHSPVQIKADDLKELNELSKEMKVVDDKWKVPAVQKNILKSLKSEGRDINILTQLGSIRRQLQLEQMKLDLNKK
ncbi:trichohyalin-like isoform X2 [Leptidea sinapis]|nr:trichohyalin-like isoform X2 [Leptidea sinapis]